MTGWGLIAVIAAMTVITIGVAKVLAHFWPLSLAVPEHFIKGKTGMILLGADVWLDAEGASRRIVNTAFVDCFFVSYKGQRVYAVMATIGERDHLIKTYPTEREANARVDQLKASLP